MKITILQTGLVPETMRDDFVSYPEMMQHMLREAGGEFSYDVIGLVEGEALPALENTEALLITGSSHGVYDPLDWIDPLRDFIRAAYAQNIPMLGICFGHQIIADALGGEVGKSDKGWGIGRHEYQVQNLPEFVNVPFDKISITASHQDQVIVAPKEAQIIAKSDFTPNAGLFYANGATLSFQPHPEFDDGFSKALFEKRAGVVFPPIQAKQAFESLQISSTHHVLGKMAADFFNYHRR